MILAATIARTALQSITLTVALVIGCCAALAASPKPVSFGSPQEAVEALIAAVRSGDATEIVKVLGPEGRAVASSGDAVADAAARERFVAAYDERNQIGQMGDGPMTLYVGRDDYPFPLPLVSDDGKWRFDTAAGAEEILDRRIGENELSVIEVMRAYVDAQREYAETDWDGKGAQYARRLLSRDKMKDGLYWPTAEGEPESPLGPLVAEARAEGYRKKRQGPEPYHGYLFRMLTAQGPHANGGARDYIVNGRMIGGFALIATPAEYGNSGVKTFIVDQDGVVFEKDLGEGSASLGNRLQSFNPDSGWSVAN